MFLIAYLSFSHCIHIISMAFSNSIDIYRVSNNINVIELLWLLTQKLHLILHSCRLIISSTWHDSQSQPITRIPTRYLYTHTFQLVNWTWSWTTHRVQNWQLLAQLTQTNYSTFFLPPPLLAKHRLEDCKPHRLRSGCCYVQVPTKRQNCYMGMAQFSRI